MYEKRRCECSTHAGSIASCTVHQATGMGESPFDADSELGGGVASLGLGGTVVSDLKEPVVLEMPGGRNGTTSRDLFTPTGELRDNFDGKVDTCQYWSVSCQCRVPHLQS